MRRTTRRDEITRLLALRERQGLTYTELSRQCGIPATTLSRWSWKLRKERQPRFTELRVVEEPPVDEARGRIRVSCGGMAVDLDSDAELEQIGRVLDLLRARC